MFNGAAKHYHWSSRRKLQRLECLRNKATDYAQNHSRKDRADYQRLMKCLKSQFEIKEDPSVVRWSVYDMKQEVGEYLEDCVQHAVTLGYLTNLSRSSCKLCLSVSLVTFLNTFVSSANFSTLLDMSSSKSFIYIKNSIGPNTDPYGTPLKTDFQFEISLSTITLCLLCVSHFSIKLITSLPWAFSLSNNL